MFLLIWGFRRRVIAAGHATYHCPVCKRVQTFALKQIARYFTLFFIPIVRSGAAVEYAVCLGCSKALRRDVVEAAQPVASGNVASSQERPALGQQLPARRTVAPRTPGGPIADSPASPRPAAAVAFIAEQPAVAPRPAFGQSAFAKATYARTRRPAPVLGAPAPSGASFFTPRR